MEIWIASGDETGGWDIVDGSFETDFTGLAWVLAPLNGWEGALQMPLGNTTALQAFSQPIARRLPADVKLPVNSPKYHVKDVWDYCNRNRLSIEVPLDVAQDDPVLELLRTDADWLLRQSGLGVLAVGGNQADAKAAGLGLSGDGLRERARAFAGLMTVALPFLPGDASLNLLVEGRTEKEIADAVRACRFAERGENNRLAEPYRDFVGRLIEYLARTSLQCAPSVTKGEIIKEFFCPGGGGLEKFLGTKARGAPFLKSNSGVAVTAMKGIADLAAALVVRPDEAQGVRLSIPPGFSGNLWSANYRELRHAIHG